MQDLTVTWPQPGRYLLAVSGGADSMVLLDLFACAAAQRGYELTVAHFDHGLRPDSTEDRALVQKTAEQHNLPFIYKEANLHNASEAAARTARHTWLEQQRVAAGASAILTAHHQDDLLETSLLNLARGSGRLGLAPMSETRRDGTASATILRPLLGVPRTDLRAYAARHRVHWREDSTNADLSNPRNFLRHRLLPAATPAWRASYLALIARLSGLNTEIDHTINEILQTALTASNSYSFPRGLIQSLDPAEVEELILAAARQLSPGIQLDRRLIHEIAAFARTGQPQKFRPLRQGITISIKRNTVNLATNPPVRLY